MPPNDSMWDWITNPLVGVKKDWMKMRKNGPDLTLHRDVTPQDGGQDGDGGVGGNGKAGVPVDSGKGDKRDKDDDSRTRNPDKDEQDKREKQKDESKKPVDDRMKDAAKDLLKKYAEDKLGPLKEKALEDLAKAWRESPGVVIGVGTVLTAAGVTYLVKTGSSLPSIPAIPLDFLAGKAPIFKGAELNIEVKGPITGPESFMVSITFHEQGGKPQSKSGSGRGKAFVLRLKLEPGGAKADSPEKGTDLIIDGNVSIPSNASGDDASATIKAIENAKVEVDVGGTPTYQVRVLSVTDNYNPGGGPIPKAPPLNRALTVRLKTSIPPMFHQGKDEIGEASVRVRLNNIGNDGDAKIKVHWEPFPSKAGAAPPGAPPSPTPLPSPAPTAPPAAPPTTKAPAKLPPLQPGDVVSIGGKNYIIFDDEVREGGSCAWRGRNPGNIRSGGKYGAIAGKKHKCGKSGEFAIFPDEATGLAAITQVVKGYGHVTVKAAMAKYAPASDGNDPVAYAKSVAKKMGVSVDDYVDALTEDQLNKFAEGIKTFEGWKEGTSFKRDDPKLPEEIRSRL